MGARKRSPGVIQVQKAGHGRLDRYRLAGQAILKAGHLPKPGSGILSSMHCRPVVSPKLAAPVGLRQARHTTRPASGTLSSSMQASSLSIARRTSR